MVIHLIVFSMIRQRNIKPTWFRNYILNPHFSFALQCVQTKASGTDISVKLPHESLLFVDLTKKELKRRTNELQVCKSM